MKSILENMFFESFRKMYNKVTFEEIVIAVTNG